MAEVVAFHGGPVAGSPPRDIIERLEGLLERARCGEISGFAYVTISPGGDRATGWDGIQGTRDALAAAIGILNHRYIAALYSGD